MKRWAHSSLMGGVGVGLNFLREKDCEKIHEASLEVLHDRGAYFDSETAREVLRDHGCWEDADGCTHFPRTLVESALEAVPAEFVHRGRTPDDDIHMAQDQVYASNFGEGIFTHDLETGERRSTVKQDAVDILRVVDSLDNIHIYNRAIGPQDVPSESASMHNAEVAFCYTSKPMHLVSGSPFQTKKMIKMAEIAAGGKEELKRRPRTAFNHTTISPLRISHEAGENAMIVAEAGLPNHILVMVQQGATSPISYAGSVAVHNADFLARIQGRLNLVKRAAHGIIGVVFAFAEHRRERHAREFGVVMEALPEVKRRGIRRKKRLTEQGILLFVLRPVRERFRVHGQRVAPCAEVDFGLEGRVLRADIRPGRPDALIIRQFLTQLNSAVHPVAIRVAQHQIQRFLRRNARERHKQQRFEHPSAASSKQEHLSFHNHSPCKGLRPLHSYQRLCLWTPQGTSSLDPFARLS